MSEKLLVPDIGDFDNVEVIELLVKPGETIKENDPIVTIESDKSSVEIPSTISGKIDTINVKVGDKVSKGDLLLSLTNLTKDITESNLPKDTENIIKQAEEAMTVNKEIQVNIPETVKEKKKNYNTSYKWIRYRSLRNSRLARIFICCNFKRWKSKSSFPYKGIN